MRLKGQTSKRVRQDKRTDSRPVLNPHRSSVCGESRVQLRLSAFVRAARFDTYGESLVR
jgi:hypothetical protein